MDPARERLEQEMDRRRLELRIRWVEVARRARMDPSNLRRIRKGEIPITPESAYGLEEALAWPHGHVDQLLTSADASTPDSRPLTELERLTYLIYLELRVQKIDHVDARRIAVEIGRLLGQDETVLTAAIERESHPVM